MLSLNQLSALTVKTLSLIALAVALSACGGSSGGSDDDGGPRDTSTDANDAGPTVVRYDGPEAGDETISRYRTAIWVNIAGEDRCGQCHIAGGQGTYAFADRSNINTAYNEAISNGLINSTNAAQSVLVTKLAKGHNCTWRDNLNNCVNDMTNWVNQFNNVGEAATFLDALNLQEPTLQSVDNSKQYPALADDGSNTDFESTVYALTSQYCSSCHSESSSLRQQPYIGSDDVQVAYEAARSRINLEDSSFSIANALSRLTARLRDEGHNCWGGSCASSSAAMHTAIQNFSNALTPVSIDPELVISRALTLDDGQAAAGGGRVETNVIAKWEFRDGRGASSAEDTSSVSPSISLNVFGNVEWLASGGVRINEGKLQADIGPNNTKIFNRIATTGEFSIEAWVVPLNVTQDGPAKIVTFSQDMDNSNFVLGQTTYDYNFHTRSSVTDNNGTPAVSTPSADEVLQATLQHVVAVYSATEGRRIYVNGELVTDNPDPEGVGNFSNWNLVSSTITLGDDPSNENQWQGTVRFLAIHDAAMSAEDIQANYDIGVGQKFYLLFNISDHIGTPRSYIVTEVEQFDDYGYLFNEPFFVTFDTSSAVTSFPVQGMRIGVNGQEAAVGQAYASLDTTVTQAAIDAEEGRQVLSNIGTVIGADQGPEIDQFFLTFDLLGSSTYVRVEATPTPQLPTPSTEEQSDIGIKTFDEINEALASLTGISKTNTEVAATYTSVKQQLPVDPGLDGFAAAQQMAVTQLAVLYCKELVESPLSSTYFPGFNFSATPTAAFDATGRSQIISPLLDRLLANTTQSADQTDSAVAEAELDGLITTLLGSCASDACLPPGNTGTRVESIVTATCASAFASGMMLIQ